ncbi:hypothetical protein C0995_006328 [Termitomyces sp. Mi166|nr:hypothetical protein C0995_006328 [Termitomyces sp. Mi166\
MAHARALSLKQFLFSNLSERAQAKLAALPHVVSLECFGVTFPSLTAMLAPYPNLTTLGVSGVIVNKDDDELAKATISPVFHPLTSLTSFSVTVTRTALPLLSSSQFFRPQNITSLSFTALCTPFFESTMAQFIMAIGTNLEHLTLFLQHYNYEDGPITLVKNGQLKTLTLQCRLDECKWCGPIISTAHHETQVTLETWLNLGNECQTIDKWRCPDLEALFSQHVDKKIALKLQVGKELETLVTLPSFNEVMERRFPELFRHGLFYIKFV